MCRGSLVVWLQLSHLRHFSERSGFDEVKVCACDEAESITEFVPYSWPGETHTDIQ